VSLNNGDKTYPSGDDVQTVEPWQPPSVWADVSAEKARNILDEINRGRPDGSRYSAANAAKDRAAWKVVQQHLPGKSELMCKRMIKDWLRTGALVEETYDDPVRHETAKGLFTNPTRRPGAV
jgi:hypothetical protein